MISPVNAFMLPFQGLPVVLSKGLRPFVMIPLMINLVLFAGLAWGGSFYFEAFMNEYVPQEGWLSYFRWLLWPLFMITYLVIMFYTFTIIANLIGSPFYGILAAKVEQRMTGKEPQGADKSIMAAIGPAVAGEIGKIIYLLKWLIPLIILMFIPGLNLLAPAAWLLFGFWFLAIEYGDYPMGNHDIKPVDQRSTLKKKRFTSLAFGAGVTVMLLIPVVGLAAMPAAVAGATRFWVDELQNHAS